MPTLIGELEKITGSPSSVTQVMVRAHETRITGAALTTDELVPIPVDRQGRFEVPLRPGKAVLVLVHGGRVGEGERFPMLVEEGLGTITSAIRLASDKFDDYEIDELERAAADMLASLDRGLVAATRAEVAHKGAQKEKVAAEEARSAAQSAAGTAATDAVQKADEKLSGYVTAAKGHAEDAGGAATSAKEDAGRAEAARQGAETIQRELPTKVGEEVGTQLPDELEEQLPAELDERVPPKVAEALADDRAVADAAAVAAEQAVATEVGGTTNIVGYTSAVYANRFVKLDAEGKLFISTTSITGAGNPVNKAYTDAGDAATLRDAKAYADQVISDPSWFKGYIHINDHLDDITESGGWTQQYTPLEGKGYPVQEGGFLSVFFGLNGWRIDFYFTWRGKQFVRRQTSSGVWSDWLQVADTALFSRVANLESTIDGGAGGEGGSQLAPVSLGWTHWGDSLTDNTYANGATTYWTDLLAAHTGQDHWNQGWGGQRTEEIAARAGALPPIVTVEGDSIPAAGTPVAAAEIKNRPTHRTGRKVYGTLAGREGYIENTSTTDTQFVPTSGTGATACPSGSRFIVTDEAANTPKRHVTIWTGYNDRWDRTPEQIVSHIDAIVQRHSAGGDRRILVMQVPRGGTAAPDGQTSQRVDSYNTALRSAFPTLWVPICDRLQTQEAADLAGITFTAEDQQDIAEGKNPRSFRTDGVHFNDAGHKAIAELMWQEIQARGWF